MSQRDEIVNAIGRAGSLREQAALVARLDSYDKGQAARVASASAIDLTDTIVRDTLSPVAVHERSTIETDWLGEATASAEDDGQQTNQVMAEAALWYGRTSPEVKADAEEFVEQARGIARRTASVYGERATGMERAFLEYVAFLHDQEHKQGASGLPQVQQLVDSHEQPAQNSLPPDVFPTFEDPVHPLNQGVVGTEGSDRAPLIQEIEQEGGGGSSESHHDETQQFAGPPPVQARPGSKQAASEEDRCTCGAAGNFDEKAHSEDCPARTNQSGFGFERPGSDFLNVSGGLDPMFVPTLAISHVGNLDEVLAMIEKEEASGLPQVEQTVDAITEKPAPTPLPEEIAFPWEIEEADEGPNTRGKQQSASRQRQAEAYQRRAAYVASLAAKNPVDLTQAERTEIQAFTASLQRTADQWTAPSSVPQQEVANSPASTPEPTDGTYAEGYAEGRSDWPDEAPTYADNSSSVPDFVRGHSQGYQDAARANPTPGGAQPGGVPPGAGGMGSYQTHSGGLAAQATLTSDSDATCDQCGKSGKRYEMREVSTVIGDRQHVCRTCAPVTKQRYERAGSLTSDSDATCDRCGKEGKRYEMREVGTVTGGRQHLCRTCAPVSKERYERAGSLRISAAFTSPVEQVDPAFVKGYRYATKWHRNVPLVTQGSAAFEAGLYAGMSDNPGQQRAWTRFHTDAARVYPDSGFGRRLSMSREFSKQASRHLSGVRVVGCYLQVEQPLRATAATSMDLETTAPTSSPSPTGSTPINGPGTKPILQGGTDPARPGGPSPYNGSEPYGTPAVPNRAVAHGSPVAIDTRPGAPVDTAAKEHLSPQMRAFRKTVQANLLAQTKPEE